MSLPDECDVFWKTVIESHRLDSEAFDEHLALNIALMLLASANSEESSASPERLLLRLRQWYGHSFERRAVLAFMSHVISGNRQARRLAAALWSNHQGPCGEVRECSLHAIGPLWSYRWLDPQGDEDSTWLLDAIEQLVVGHPLRA